MNSAKLCLLCLYRERLLAERMKLKFWSMVFVDGAFSGGLFRSAFISLRGKQMKKTMVLALLACAAISTTSARAEDFAGVKTAKAVWDITTGDEKIFVDRIGLIKKTADGLKKRGIQPDFVLVIHGPAAKFATKTLAGTKFEKEKLNNLDKAQSTLQNIMEEGSKIEVCSIAMERGKIAKDNVQPFAVIEDNVFENTIVLENKGYAYMPVH